MQSKDTLRRSFFAIVLLLLSSRIFAQVTIHNWSFNVSTPPSGGQWPASIAATTGSGILTHTFTDARSFTGTTLNAETGDVQGGSFCPLSNVNNGNYLQLSVPTTGYISPILTYATQRNNPGGFTTQQISYSTDGTTFAFFVSFTSIPVSYALHTVDFSGIPAAGNNPNFKIRITVSGATAAGDNNRFDNVKLQGAAPLQDGDGSATLVNAGTSGVLTNTTIFHRNSPLQRVTMTIVGTSAGTLTSASIEVPLSWGTVLNANVSLSGAGFSGASSSVSNNIITISSTLLTSSATGTVTIDGLTTPNPVSVTDDGNYTFLVKTAKSGGTLTSIGISPKAYVMIPIANIRDQDANGVPLDLNTTVAIEGITTVSTTNFAGFQLQLDIQDTSGAVHVFRSGVPPVIPESHDCFVKGTVEHFNGLTELVLSSYADLIDNGATSPIGYQLVTIPMLMANPEVYESKLIAIQHLTRIGTALWPTVASTGDSALTMSDPSANAIAFFIDRDVVGLNGSAEPSWPRDVQGIFSQSDTSFPYIGTFSTYRIIPRRLSDVAPDGSLPVQLASFAGRLVGQNTARLSWSTISEINNYGFYIERRAANEIQFTELPNSFIPGHGTTNEPHQYSFIDSTITPGVSVWHYRLKQVDLDGTIHLTEPISVSTVTVVEPRNEIPKSFSLSQNYPNPFNPRTTIEFGLPRQTHAVIEVFNILGQRVALLVSEVRAAGYHQVPFDAGGLSSGMYVYRISAGDFVQTKKLLLLQ
jgi:hypothetical protein